MRIALGIAYSGTGYDGWQSQPGGRTIQDRLQAALSDFAAMPIATVCAGRTDAGVHALMQVVHLDTQLERDDFSWVRGTNRFLPRDIAVQWAHVVPGDFHARANAISRRYSYLLLESRVRPAVEAGRAGWTFRPVVGEAMRDAASRLVGTHDFTSMRASSCQARSPVKTLKRIDIHRRGAYWRFDFEADAFLHHMVRNIMGCLVAVGQGQHPPQWLDTVLAARDRDVAAPTFAAEGLYFLGPTYDSAWGLPERTAAYDWLP